MNKYLRALRPVWLLLAGHRWRAAGIVALMFIAGITEFVGLSMLVPIVGAAVGQFDSQSVYVGALFDWFGGPKNALIAAGASMIAAIIVKEVLTIITVRERMRLSLDLRNEWSQRIFDGALRAPLATLSRRRTGELVEAISSETQKAGNAIASLLDAVRRYILALILFIGLVITAPLLTVAVSVVIVLTFLALYPLTSSLVEGRKMLQHSREVANVTAETMANIRQIKLLDAYAERLSTLRRALDDFAKVRVRFETTSQIPTSAIEIVVAVFAVTALVGAYHWSPELVRTSVPTLALFVVVANRLVTTLGALSNQTMKLNVGLANIAYVMKRLSQETTAEQLDRGKVFAGVRMSIKLANVQFAWPDGNPVLEHMTMEFHRGQVTAIVGASGRGKSTVAAMVCGLLQPDSGELLIDGEPISLYSLRSLRQEVGYVTQEIELFHATVTENVRMG